EDEAEPLDLLDRNALANISTTKPGRRGGALRGGGRRMKARTDADGKLILGGEDAGAMDVDNETSAAAGGEGEERGVGACVAGWRGKDVGGGGMRGEGRGKGGGGNADEDGEGGGGGGGMDVDEGAAAKAFRDRAGRDGGRKRGGGGDGRGRGGGGGG